MVRLVVCAALGVVVSIVAGRFVPWQLAATAGWCAFALATIIWVVAVVAPLDPDGTRTHATLEDNGRNSTRLILVSASVASLGGAAADLLKANQSTGGAKIAFTVFGALTVILAWTVVHSTFTLRYAHEFYTLPIGGIDFKTDKESPDYRDFAYVAFTVGMTFQVSDTDIQSRIIRRSVLRHALLAYLFGAVILAMTVNVVASLFT
jgi:uncharacterized membrane protein